MERIILLAVIIFVISPNVTNAQEYIPGYNLEQVDAILQDEAGFESDGKEKWENTTTYYYKRAQGPNSFMVDVHTNKNGEISKITAQVNNISSDENLSKSFLQLVGSLLSGGASKKFEEELSPWIVQHYKEGGKTTFRGVRVDLESSGLSWQMLILRPSE